MTILINVQHEPSRCNALCHEVIKDSAGPCLDGLSASFEQCFDFAAKNAIGIKFSWGY